MLVRWVNIEHLVDPTGFPGSNLSIWDCRRRQLSLARNCDTENVGAISQPHWLSVTAFPVWEAVALIGRRFASLAQI